MTYLNDNPTVVITILFANPQRLSIKKHWTKPFEDSGIANISYIPSSLSMQQSQWPTLGEMIAAGTRVVNFVDQVGRDNTTLPYIITEFENVRAMVTWRVGPSDPLTSLGLI